MADDCKIEYDEKFKIGNTTLYIVAPDVSYEENIRRKQEVDKAASLVVKNLIAENKF